MSEKPEVGSITWSDLTEPNAEELKDFYSKVVGWKSAPVSMGDYNDFNMNSPDSGETKAGICHKRAGNAELPSQWLIYFTVRDVNESAGECKASGGKVIAGPKDMGKIGKIYVIDGSSTSWSFTSTSTVQVYSPPVTGVEDTSWGDYNPEEFALHQNYPIYYYKIKKEILWKPFVRY